MAWSGGSSVASSVLLGTGVYQHDIRVSAVLRAIGRVKLISVFKSYIVTQVSLSISS